MKKRGRIVTAGVLIAAVAVILALALRRSETTDHLAASGTVEATDAQLGFQVPGRILEVLRREGDRVAEGDLLARLDTAEIVARRDQSLAHVDAARALLAEMEQGPRKQEIAQARAARDAARQRLDDAARDLARSRSLFEGGAVSQEAYDKSNLAREVAASQYDAAREQLEMLEAGTRTERIDAQRAAVAQAEASARAIDAGIEQMTLRAPFGGIVTRRHREPGETVGAGSPVLTLMNPDDRWVRIYIPETRIAAVHLGTPCRIFTDLDPDRAYAGTIVYISSESEFTPKTVQTAEERVKLVYAAKVRIEADSSLDLKPGMPVDVRLDLKAR